MVDQFTMMKVASHIRAKTDMFVLREKLAVQIYGHEYRDLVDPERVLLHELLRQTTSIERGRDGMEKLAINMGMIEGLVKAFAPAVEKALPRIGEAAKNWGFKGVEGWANAMKGVGTDQIAQSLKNIGQLGAHYVKSNPWAAAGAVGLGGVAALGARPLLRRAAGFGLNMARGMAAGGVQTAAKPLLGTGTKLMLGVGGAGALAYGVGGGIHSRISNDRQMAAMQDPQAYGQYLGYNPEQKV